MPPGSWIAAGNNPGGGSPDFCWLCFNKSYDRNRAADALIAPRWRGSMLNAIKEAIEDIPALNQRDALTLADEIVDDMIAALKRDRETAFRSFAQWELALANLRARIAERITNEIAGHVSLSAVLLEIEAATDWQELLGATNAPRCSTACLMGASHEPSSPAWQTRTLARHDDGPRIFNCPDEMGHCSSRRHRRAGHVTCWRRRRR